MRKVQVTMVLFFALVAFIVHASLFRPMKNFHVVQDGMFYRSAQLTGPEFEEAVQKYGIKTVINLRGSKPDQSWYQDEESTLARLGVDLESVSFLTDHVPNVRELIRYTEILKTAKRPILVHCRAGSDRTGEATAIYILDYMHGTREQALDALSLRYLHVEMFQPAKRYFIEHYQGPEWAKTSYDPCRPEFRRYASKWVCPDPKPSTVTTL